MNNRFDMKRPHTEVDPDQKPSAEVDPKLRATYALVGVDVPKRAPSVASAPPSPRTIASLMPGNVAGLPCLVEGAPFASEPVRACEEDEDDGGEP